jgi:hypothetical protein
MKKFNYLFFVVFLLILSSCNKDLIDDKKTSDLKILHFDSYSQMQEELSTVLKMTTEEKANWAASKGFTSYGVEADLFYESVDPKKFRNKEEIIAFVDNSKYLEVVNEYDGEKSVQIIGGNNKFRYFTNVDKMFTVADKAFKIFGDETIITCIENKDALKYIQNVDEVINNTDFNIKSPQKVSTKSINLGCGSNDKYDTGTAGNYRVKLELWLENDYVWSFGGTYARTHWKATSQKKTIFWFNSSNNISYNIHIVAKYRNLSYNGTWSWYPIWVNESGTKNSSSIYQGVYEVTAGQGNWDSQIYFEEYNCSANVPETINDKAVLTCGM